MRTLATVAGIRAVERVGLEQLPEGTLMGRAADAVADAAERALRSMPRATPVFGLVGPGNNGADALEALCRLSDRGFATRAFLLDARAPFEPDAARARARWQARGDTPRPLGTLAAELARLPGPPLVLDGLFGIGLSRALPKTASEALEALDAHQVPVIAIDVPSGIDADRGGVIGGGVAVRAVTTVTMIADKPGLHTGAGREHAGQVVVADLGLAAPLPEGDYVDRRWCAARLPPRPADAHKGDFGTVGIVGGSVSMPGAALLAALGAQAGGAGKVAICGLDGRIFDPGSPQLMAWESDTMRDACDVLAIGCGLGTSARARRRLADCLGWMLPAVVDADALNLLAAEQAPPHRATAPGRPAPAPLRAALRQRARQACATVITPHPLEAARLLACPTATVQANRVGAALELARKFGAVCVLKGAGSVVAGPDGRWALVGSGGPALASGGTGDVLAGLAAALLCVCRDAFVAAAIAAWAHGDAGDRWTIGNPRAIGLSSAELPLWVTESLNAL